MLKRGVKTVGDFAKAYPDGSYIVDTSKHWTAVVDGVIYDTWDCSQELIDEGAFLMERQRVMDTLPPEPIGMDGLSELFASIDSSHLYLKSNFFTRLRRAKYALSEIYGEFREKNEIRDKILELLKYE
jgi:hypothetical protein